MPSTPGRWPPGAVRAPRPAIRTATRARAAAAAGSRSRNSAGIFWSRSDSAADANCANRSGSAASPSNCRTSIPNGSLRWASAARSSGADTRSRIFSSQARPPEASPNQAQTSARNDSGRSASQACNGLVPNTDRRSARGRSPDWTSAACVANWTADWRSSGVAKPLASMDRHSQRATSVATNSTERIPESASHSTTTQPLGPSSRAWRPWVLPGKTIQGRSRTVSRVWTWPSAQ